MVLLTLAQGQTLVDVKRACKYYYYYLYSQFISILQTLLITGLLNICVQSYSTVYGWVPLRAGSQKYNTIQSTDFLRSYLCHCTKIIIYVVLDLSCLCSRDLSLLTAKQKSLQKCEDYVLVCGWCQVS